MKKFKKIIVFVLLACVSVMLSACTLQDVEKFLFGTSPSNFTAVSIEDLTSDETLSLLLSTRSKIREFNVYIESNLFNTFGNMKVNEITNLGSGSIIAKGLDFKTYYVITNNHVIDSEGYSHVNYTIETINGNNYVASLVYKNADKDMAILSFVSLEDLTIANFTERLEKPLTTDEFLLAVGNPNGVKNVVTYGKYLGTTQISNVDYNVIHHNALINPGNSGGALTDLNGFVVGINTWGTTDNDEDNYAIPLSQVKIFLEEVKQAKPTFPTVM